MTFTGFEAKDFDTFNIEGLEERMEAIRSRIQPKFQAISEDIADDLSQLVGQEMHLHIAQHARRTVNPPKDTWSAYCHNKRGYKKHPHFQIGLFDDHVFVWLAYIYELPTKSEIATKFLDHLDDISSTIPKDYVISLDHMKKESSSVGELDLKAALDRFQKVKKAEFLVGKHFAKDSSIIKNGDAFIIEVKDIFSTLSPLYKLSMHD
ncbi:DUF1054 domain-containing protein [Radiobacillus kanasensis]|uniref:YktB family protein n=1 Tax=Radiobacillus kanasensis TaxID=2844358 RepID=UPI001E45BB6E|nr:DUF1054 domain-containing protein [Radiobacillus kanasensis]UFU00890.1 DUF1054 domain-containing protein [Radiobacillus kanasensis]